MKEKHKFIILARRFTCPCHTRFTNAKDTGNNYVTIHNKMGSLSQGAIYSITLTATNFRKNFPVKDVLYLIEYDKFKKLIR